MASNEAKKLQYKLKKVSQVLLLRMQFKKGDTVLGSLVVDNTDKPSYIQALNSIKPYNTISKIEGGIKNISFKLLINGNLCVAYRKNNESFVRITVFDKDLNLLTQKLSNSDAYRRFKLVELKKSVVLCSFDRVASATSLSASSMLKFDSSLNYQSNIRLDYEIVDVDAHEKKLYLLSASSDRKLKHIFVYDESLMLLNSIKLEIREMSPFCVPISVSKIVSSGELFCFSRW